MNIDGRKYDVVIATDVERDSMQWECYLIDGTQRTLLFEIVRFDGKKEWAFLSHAETVPLAAVEYATQRARSELGPFFNG